MTSKSFKGEPLGCSEFRSWIGTDMAWLSLVTIALNPFLLPLEQLQHSFSQLPAASCCQLPAVQVQASNAGSGSEILSTGPDITKAVVPWLGLRYPTW